MSQVLRDTQWLQFCCIGLYWSADCLKSVFGTAHSGQTELFCVRNHTLKSNGSNCCSCPSCWIHIIKRRTRFFFRESVATQRSCWKTSLTSATPSREAWLFSAGETTTTTMKTGGSCGRRASTASSTTGRRSTASAPLHQLISSQRLVWWPARGRHVYTIIHQFKMQLSH